MDGMEQLVTTDPSRNRVDCKGKKRTMERDGEARATEMQRDTALGGRGVLPLYMRATLVGQEIRRIQCSGGTSKQNQGARRLESAELLD